MTLTKGQFILSVIVIIIIAFYGGMWAEEVRYRDVAIIPTSIESDMASIHHEAYKALNSNITMNDIYVISYLLSQYVDAPYMNDIEKLAYYTSVVQTCDATKIKDPYLFYAQGIIESALNPRALGKAKEIGIHQVKPSTAKEIYKIIGQNPDSISTGQMRIIGVNTRLAGLYLKYLLNKHGNIECALSAYNGRSPKASIYSQKVLQLRNQLEETIHVKRASFANETN